jgi:hypothetical protein
MDLTEFIFEYNKIDNGLKQFHLDMKPYGGYLDLNKMDQSLRSYYGMSFLWKIKILKALDRFYNQKIYPCFLNNNNINAFVMKDEKKEYLLAIYAGFTHKIIKIFNLLLSNPDILPDLGNSKGEVGGTVYDGSNISFPNCKIRNAHAQYLSVLAEHFLFFHELSHIYDGHIEYFNTQTKKKFFMEFDPESRQKIGPNISMAMELEADMLATALNLEIVISFYEKEGSTMVSKVIDTPYDSLFGIGFLWAFAISVLFSMFEFELGNIVANRNYIRTHPPSTTRELTIQTRAKNILSTRYPKYIKDISDGIVKGMVAAAPVKRIMNLETIDKVSLKEAETLIAYWKNERKTFKN